MDKLVTYFVCHCITTGKTSSKVLQIATYRYDIDCSKGETTYICNIVYFKLPYVRIVPPKLFASVSATRPYGTIEIT